MALVPDSPNTEPVPVTQNKPVNHVRIVATLAYSPVDEPDHIHIQWREGHKTAGGTVHWKPGTKSVRAIALPTDEDANPYGDELLAVMLSTVANGSSMRDALKDNAYQFLVDAGLVEGGTIE